MRKKREFAAGAFYHVTSRTNDKNGRTKCNVLPTANSNIIKTKNQTATVNFVKNEYPDEKFISDVSQIKNQNKYTNGLIIPKGVKVAESRMSRSTKQMGYCMNSEKLPERQEPLNGNLGTLKKEKVKIQTYL